MRHWLRIEQVALGGIPHWLIIDEGRLDEVIGYLRHAGAGDCRYDGRWNS